MALNLPGGIGGREQDNSAESRTAGAGMARESTRVPAAYGVLDIAKENIGVDNNRRPDKHAVTSSGSVGGGLEAVASPGAAPIRALAFLTEKECPSPSWRC